MRHRRLYVIPEYYRDDEGVIPNAFVYSANDDSETHVLGSSDNDMCALLSMARACSIVSPSATTLWEILYGYFGTDLPTNLGYDWEGILERGIRFGYKGPMRDTALLMGIKYPKSIWRDASFFREPGSLGRHLPKEDEELFRKVIDHDKEVLRAMREIDRRIVKEEEEFYRVFEKGRLGSTSERGFAWEKEQMMQQTLYNIRGMEHRADDVTFRITIPYVPVPPESWQRRYYSALCSVSTAASEWKDRAVRLGDKLPICFSRKGNRIEVYPDGCFPIFYHMAKPSSEGFTAMRGGTIGEPMFNTDITPADAVGDLVAALRHAQVRDLFARPGIGICATKVASVTPTDVTLYVDRAMRGATEEMLTTWDYKYEIIEEEK